MYMLIKCMCADTQRARFLETFKIYRSHRNDMKI